MTLKILVAQEQAGAEQGRKRKSLAPGRQRKGREGRPGVGVQAWQVGTQLRDCGLGWSIHR